MMMKKDNNAYFISFIVVVIVWMEKKYNKLNKYSLCMICIKKENTTKHNNRQKVYKYESRLDRSAVA